MVVRSLAVDSLVDFFEFSIKVRAEFVMQGAAILGPAQLTRAPKAQPEKPEAENSLKEERVQSQERKGNILTSDLCSQCTEGIRPIKSTGTLAQVLSQPERVPFTN